MKKVVKPLFVVINCFFVLCLLISIHVSGQSDTSKISSILILPESELNSAAVDENIPVKNTPSVLFLPPCCSGGPPANNNFSGTANLVVGAAPISGNTCGATIEAGENLECNGSADQSVWYSFTATATTTYVVINSTGSCFVGSAIWVTASLPSGTCPHSLSCQASAYGPSTTAYQLATTVGQTYNIQITYPSGGPCGSGGCFDINVTNTNPGGITNPPPSNTCATANPTCWFASPPTALQITSNCTQYAGPIGPNIITCVSVQFTNGGISSQADFQGYITSNCGVGTINWFDWTLYDASCNYITCGAYPNMSLTSLECNTTYTLEYCFETGGCTWTNWYWYFNAPAAPPPCAVLLIELVSFTANCSPKDGQQIKLNWLTAAETNNDYFTVERSADGINYEVIGTVNGAGNSSSIVNYEFIDNDLPFQYSIPNAQYYYRLKQTDFNGKFEYFDPVAVEACADFAVFPNPAENELNVRFFSETDDEIVIEVHDVLGKTVIGKTSPIAKGSNLITLNISTAASGVYVLKAKANKSDWSTHRKFVKSALQE